MKVSVSFIIPCYNSELTLEETLVSIIHQSLEDWEALIINDGSIDSTENIALNYVEKDNRFRYFKKCNEGLGATRNYGIREARGEFILPLDSDNLIEPDFAFKALKIFKKEKNVGVIYGDALYLGEKSGLWKVGEFDELRMLKHNYIDACALIRKSLFDIIGLYDVKLPHQGHEDWDLWLRVFCCPYQFYYLNEISFRYRVTKTSMINSFNEKMLEENINYIKTKHFKLYENALWEIKSRYDNLLNEYNTSFYTKLIKKFNRL